MFVAGKNDQETSRMRARCGLVNSRLFRSVQTSRMDVTSPLGSLIYTPPFLPPDVLTHGTGRHKARRDKEGAPSRDEISSRESVSGPRALTAARPPTHPHQLQSTPYFVLVSYCIYLLAFLFVFLLPRTPCDPYTSPSVRIRPLTDRTCAF